MPRFWKLTALGAALTLPILIVLVATDQAEFVPVLLVWLAVVMAFPLIHRAQLARRAGGDRVPRLDPDDRTPLGDTDQLSRAPGRHSDPARGTH